MNLYGSGFIIINQLPHLQGSEESSSVYIALDMIFFWEYLTKNNIFLAEDAQNLTCILEQTSGRISEPVTQAGNGILGGGVFCTASVYRTPPGCHIALYFIENDRAAD